MLNLKKQIRNNNGVVYGICGVLLFLCVISFLQPYLLYLIPIVALACNAYLYYHAKEFTNLSGESRKVDTYRALILLSAFVAAVFFLLMIAQAVLPNQSHVFEDMRYMLLVFFLLVFSNQAPKIPYNRTLGLRISWTLDDEATWKYAHRMVGYCGIPSALAMVVCYVSGYQQIGFLFLLLTILIPAVLSFFYYRSHGWVLTETTSARKSIWFIPILHSFINCMLYSYLPYDFPMQVTNKGAVVYTQPKPFALSLMIISEVVLICFFQYGSAKRLWTMIGLMFLAFMGILFYVLMQGL